MKSYMDIQNLREFDEEISAEIIKKNNAEAFQVGDLIQISEKYDGSNASIEYFDGDFHAFSRNQELTPNSTLNGFYTYMRNLVDGGLQLDEGYVVFGEWSGARNKIVYEHNHVWIVFDIFNRKTEQWMSQEFVKGFCEVNGLEYIHELYNGPFVSWDHCRTFLHSPGYGERQEGIVVKNQSKLVESRSEFYLKIVNDDFKETQKQRVRTVDPEKEAAKELSMELMKTIVTKARVEKMLFKMRDEGIIPSELTPKDMGTIAKNLPKRIWDDCSKEEPETVKAAGDYAGRACSSISIDIARSLVL